MAFRDVTIVKLMTSAGKAEDIPRLVEAVLGLNNNYEIGIFRNASAIIDKFRRLDQDTPAS